MRETLPSWIYRALIGITIIVGVFVWQSYKVFASNIPIWDKTGIVSTLILCSVGLIYLFSREYEKHKGNPNDNKKLHSAIVIPLAILGLISAYMIIPPFLKGISLENNSPAVSVAKVISFAAIAVIVVADIFYARK